MAASSNERRNQVMVGDLPADFLRLGPGNTSEQQQISSDYQTAQMLQAQQAGYGFAAQNSPRLSVTLIQARLTKNYGLTKMDPYCRLRVGHSVFETQTDNNGAKSPKWNKTIHCFLPQGVDSIYVELFDERAFTIDERIAWGHISIPEQVMAGETVDDWYVLNGKQGEGREGSIQIVLTYAEVAAPQPVPPTVMYTGSAPVVMVPAQNVYYPQQTVVPIYQTVPAGAPPGTSPQPQQLQQPHQPHMQAVAQPPPGPAFTDEDVKQVKDMFPSVDEEVIRSILEVNRGNKDLTINNLLQMES